MSDHPRANGDHERFAWPPAKRAEPRDASPSAAGEVPSQAHRAPVQAQARSTNSAWSEIERAWLGLRTPPLAQRLALAGWQPDSRGAYCWRCGRTVGAYESDDEGCGRCRTQKVHWERMIRLGSFDGVLREMVHEVKFTRWRRLGYDLGALLGVSVGQELARNGVDPESVVVVPVPMSTWRRLSRGIDHTNTLAQGVARALDAPIVHAMSRRHRPTQWSIPASERQANVARSFRLREDTRLEGRLVVLVDDVTTSRATLTAACKALQQESLKGSKEEPFLRIWCAVVSVTPEPEQDRRASAAAPESRS